MAGNNVQLVSDSLLNRYNVSVEKISVTKWPRTMSLVNARYLLKDEISLIHKCDFRQIISYLIGSTLREVLSCAIWNSQRLA